MVAVLVPVGVTSRINSMSNGKIETVVTYNGHYIVEAGNMYTATITELTAKNGSKYPVGSSVLVRYTGRSFYNDIADESYPPESVIITKAPKDGVIDMKRKYEGIPKAFRPESPIIDAINDDTRGVTNHSGKYYHENVTPHNNYKAILKKGFSVSVVNDDHTAISKPVKISEGTQLIVRYTEHETFKIIEPAIAALRGELSSADLDIIGYTRLTTVVEDTADSNDGSNDGTSHYNLPDDATELKHLIWYKDMNAQVGEIFRACWRLGAASHSDKRRDLNKIIAYAEQELERMDKYGE